MGGPAEFGPHVGYLQLPQTSPSRVLTASDTCDQQSAQQDFAMCSCGRSRHGRYSDLHDRANGSGVVPDHQTGPHNDRQLCVPLLLSAVKWQLDMDQWYCLFRSSNLQAVRHRSGHGYHEEV